jgi:chemosensory pili system protein ChpA (sensor histidine kinase/response regulator)
MQSEQQQRIMGYFIEEAKDHLNTIETGLLNLQSTIEDTEMVSEVFRAAHSVKGGAAMLGLSSIQHTAHRLEDYFKVLRECPVQVDQKLETLFLRVFDTLQELLDQLQGPFGLTEEKSDEMMADVEPVFASLNEHLMDIVSKSGATPPDEVDLSPQAPPVNPPKPKPAAAPPEEESALLLVFRSDVPGHLRSMLQLFKQTDNADTRQQLQNICRELSQAGEQFDLSQWCNLTTAAQKAIATTDNSYRALAPVLIKDIKAAQELVLSGKADQVTCSDALTDLVPAELPDLDLGFDDATTDIDADLDSLFAGADQEEVTSETIDFDFFSGSEPDSSASSEMLSFEDLTAINDTDIVEREDMDIAANSADQDDDDWFTSGLEASDADDGATDTADFDFGGDGAAMATSNGAASDGLDLIDALEENPDAALEEPDAAGPEMGAAELNTLADLFEGESLDLGSGWQEEEVISDDVPSLMDDDLELEPTSDFSDLLFDQDTNGSATETSDAPIASDAADENGAIALGSADAAEDLGEWDGLDGLDFAEADTEASDEDGLGDLDLFETDAPDDDAGSGALDGLGSDFDDLFEEASAPVTSTDDDIETDLLGLGMDASSHAEAAEAGIAADHGESDDLDDLFGESDDPFGALDSTERSIEMPVDDEPDETSAMFGDLLSDAEAIASLEEDLNIADDDPSNPSESEAREVSGDLEVDLWGESDSTATDSSDLDIDQMFGASDDDLDALLADNDLDLDASFDDALFEEDDDTSESSDAFPDAIAMEAPAATDSLIEENDELGDLDLDFLDEPGLGEDDSGAIAAEPVAIESSTATDSLAEENDELGDLDLDFLDEPGLGEDDNGAIAAEPVEEESGDADFFDSGNTSDFVEGLFADDDTAATESAQQDADELDLSGLDLDLDAMPTLDDDPVATDADNDTDEGLDILDDLDGFLTDDAEATATEATSDFDFDWPDLADETAEDPADDAIADDDFSDLDALLDEPESATTDDTSFDELDALLDDSDDDARATSGDDFSDLEALLGDDDNGASPLSGGAADDDLGEFDDLEKLLEDADKSLGGPPTVKGARRVSPTTPSRRTVRRGHSDQTMRVSVKNLDNLNNLIGELVVNRNSLEQTQERLRQFLDNLLYQVQQLSDVGQRMRDLYERSLLESSLLTSRKNHFSQPAAADGPSHATGASFDALEMDRFTGFHTLSQEMIELIVRVRESASDIDFVVDESDQITRTFRQVTTQLQEGLTRARMVPFAQTADRLPRAVRDISLKCGKQAELVVEGRDTLIDKMILESLYDPMTHLVNNAITHGIETPEERAAAGKPPTGRITIRSFHQGNQTVISISDDGAGIDSERVKVKAIQKGLITQAEASEMTRLDVYDLLFHSGFSTRDKADDYAGRGVGMDVVRTNLTEIRGAINTDSAVGKGTTFTIRLPLTLSISKALCCISNRARIAFPMDGVEDMLDVPRDRIQQDEEGQPCITWREMLLPFQPLSELLSHNRSLGRGSVYGGNQEDEMVSVIVLRSAGNFLALQVDQVLGEQEIVIKQLEGPVPKPVGIAGATVLGDGRIMPIADVLELIDLSMGRIRRDSSGSLWAKDDVPIAPEGPPTKTEPTVLIVDDSITVRELLSMTFNKVGYRVEQARDGQEAWEKLRSGLPCDLVFCDIEMPRMDGLELLSRIQKDSNLSGLPIAMLTSRGADRHRQMAITLGAKGYFTKPYLEEALLDAAQRMLKGEVLVGAVS